MRMLLAIVFALGAGGTAFADSQVPPNAYRYCIAKLGSPELASVQEAFEDGVESGMKAAQLLGWTFGIVRRAAVACKEDPNYSGSMADAAPLLNAALKSDMLLLDQCSLSLCQDERKRLGELICDNPDLFGFWTDRGSFSCP
jgi:hypothetical protein